MYDPERHVVIIGAGFTGLSTALHLREAGIDVAIIEAAEPGFGGSADCRTTAAPSLSRLWPVTDQRTVSAVTGLLGPKPLFIADGHHRYETARVYADEVGGEGPHRYVLMCLVALEDPGLTVFPTHRLVRGLRPEQHETLANAIREALRKCAATLPLGMINLHTGLSPYARGGNCNLFMLLERHPELVGITVHHIDGGIDRGDIIITDRPDMSEEDSYEMIEVKTFRLGNDRLMDAVRRLATGEADRIPQWTEGKLFLRRTGYLYEPYLHVQVNRILSYGLIANYHEWRDEFDAGIRLVGAD
jgi:hypothetical protein